MFGPAYLTLRRRVKSALKVHLLQKTVPHQKTV